MPSVINAQAGSYNQATALIKTGASDANLVLQTNGANAVTVNQTQTAIFNSTGAVKLPSGTAAQRPASPVNGMIRFNTDISRAEGYANNTWVAFL